MYTRLHVNCLLFSPIESKIGIRRQILVNMPTINVYANLFACEPCCCIWTERQTDGRPAERQSDLRNSQMLLIVSINPLNPELNPICYLLALLGAHHFLHVSRIRVKLLTFKRKMSYTYGAPILDVSRSHTTTQHSR